MARTWRDVFELGDRGQGQPTAPRSQESANADAAPGAGRGMLRRLRDSLSASRTALRAELTSTLFDRLDDAAFERLVEALILADVGPRTTADVVGRLEAEVEAGSVVGPEAARRRLIELLAEVARTDGARIDLTTRPAVIMIVGVNGTGKTTTIGKIAWHLTQELGLSVIAAAADTFRAAAIEQLETWAERAGADLVRGSPGGDAGAVVFDAIAAAEARGADVVDVTGVILTKLDGTAKGGIALAIARELGIPVKLIGVGEGLEDLRPFDPREFAEALLGDQ